MIKVVFCSSTIRGARLAERMRQMPCELVLVNTENQKLADFPDYDLGISFLYTYRVPAKEFETGRRWVNFHPGPLPDMRGRNLAYHAILEQRESFGATIHYMDADFDTGDLIEVVRFPISSQALAGDLVEQAHQALENLFEKWIPRLLTETIVGTKQPMASGKYYKREVIDEALELSPAQQLKIRALSVPPKHFPKVVFGKKVYNLALIP